MTKSTLAYPLSNGYIHNWLVAGPQAILVADLERYQGTDYKMQIAEHYYEQASGVNEMPAEEAPFTLGDYQTTWRYVRTLEDHFVDLTLFHHICHYLRAWAYAQVMSPSEQEVSWVLTTNGPADVWINGDHVHRQAHFQHQSPRSQPFSAKLSRGTNEILVRFEEVAARECPYTMALRLVNFRSGAQITEPVRLPTTMRPLKNRQSLEKAFDAAYLLQDVYRREDEITVRWSDDLADTANLTVRLQTPDARIYAEGNKFAKAGASMPITHPYEITEGPHEIFLMPRPREYYEKGMRITRTIPLYAVKNVFSTTPYGTPEERRIEALVDAANRHDNVFSDIARIALGWWERVDLKMFASTIDRINKRADCSDFYLCGLLGMLYRFGEDPNFPPELKHSLEECILNFKYWDDEPGSDSMCYRTENHSILFHTCEVLAGQMFPDRIFTNVNQPGAWHRQKGEERALEWLRKRAASGFREWDSNCYFEEDTLALSTLADLAENSAVWELASVVLDKMYFTMAVNSFKGVFGSTHGRTYTQHIKGGYREATTGISRLLWGQGIFSANVLGTVSLACSRYQLPETIGYVACDLPEEMWNRERHSGSWEDFASSGSATSEINKVTYKTADYMLSSAQDYHPGNKGYQQHIWQATFSPEGVVFVTHPKCASEEGSHRPNFWHGNETLPRVCQWKDVLFGIYNLPDDDWMGFTHAYFPTAGFDNYDIRENWAFARVGKGYLALTAARGLDFIRKGRNAFRELRSYGKQNIWVCQMGRATLDGSFDRFQQKVMSLPLDFNNLSVRYQSLRGDTLEFGWEGPLLLNGKEQPITGFKHYENPYCTVETGAPEMEITCAGTLLKLKFGD